MKKIYRLVLLALTIALLGLTALAAQQEFLLCGHVQRQERQQQEKRSFFHLSGVGTDALRCAGEVSCKVFCRLLSTNISILFRKSNTPPRSVRIIGEIAIFVV